MTDDLIKNYDFTNMTREQVINLLGEPDEKPSYPEYSISVVNGDSFLDLENPNSICYIIKGHTQAPEEMTAFYLRFNEDGKVIDFGKIGFYT